MNSSYQIAIAVYHRILKNFSIRAGEASALILDWHRLDWVQDDVAEQAEALAMPGERVTHGDTVPLLSSVMGHLEISSIEHQESSIEKYYLPTTVSNQAAMSFVENDSDPERDTSRLYQKHWQDFKQDCLQGIHSDQSWVVQEANLYALMQRFAWSIPAPMVNGEQGDISLFDYARMSGALAVCLAEQRAEDSEAALLVGADLSGVQDWLYTLSSSGAARSLRGRSVYLQLLMEVIALDLLNKLELPMANLLYVGGGNFYMLIPSHRYDELKAYHKKATRSLLRMHQGALYLALDASSIPTEELSTQSVGKAWARVTQKLNKQKQQRFAELSEEEMVEAIGKPLDGTGLPERNCNVCHRFITEAEYEWTEEDENANNPGERKCALCCSFSELGSQLSRASFLTLIQTDKPTEQAEITSWYMGLRSFGFNVHFLAKERELKPHLQRFQNRRSTRIFFWKSPPNFKDIIDLQTKQHTILSFRPLAQCVPIDERGATATFDIFETKGVKRWGALRMDVDRLGEIFREGIQPASLSRIVGLSNLMRLFFEGYVPTLAERFHTKAKGNELGNPRIQLMYAGGDDLFVVGGWSWLPELAEDIQQAFAEFACHNPAVTISGGISLAHSEKYPLYRAAEDAGEAEHQSKDGGRNALTFLEETLSWTKISDEIDIRQPPTAGLSSYKSYWWVTERVKALTAWLAGEEDALPRSFLMALRAIDAEYRDWKKQETGGRAPYRARYQHEDKPILYLGPWQWHLIYSLNRAAERTQNKDYQSHIQALTQHILAGEISSIGLSARWVEFLTRKAEEKAL